MLYKAKVDELARPVTGGKQLPQSFLNEKIKKPRKPRAKKIKEVVVEETSPEETSRPGEVDSTTQGPVPENSQVEQVDPEERKIDEAIETKQSEIEDIARKVRELEQIKNEKEKPPKWFNDYIKNMKTDENAFKKVKKPRKVIAKEAEQEASTHWANDHTRNLAQSAADQHLIRMQNLYKQMFRR